MVDVPEDEYEERVRRARLARQEARETIDEQTETLSDIDEKAIQIFRANIILATILVSTVSVAISFESGSPGMLLTPYTKTAACLLFVSTIVAAITYTSTSVRIGVSKTDISNRVLDLKYDYDLVEEGIASEYGEWIQYNYERNASNSLLFTISLLSVVASICYLIVGIIDIYSDELITVHANVAVLLFFLVFGKLSGVYGQAVRWWNVTSPSNRFRNWCSNRKNTVHSFLSDTVNAVRGGRDDEPTDGDGETNSDNEDADTEDGNGSGDSVSGQVT